MWEYEFSKDSIKALERLDSETVSLLKNKVKSIGSWLDGGDRLHADIKKLKGKWEGFYRLRVREIRVIFTFDNRSKTIKVCEIGFRGDIYK
jgi:mRNA interferase RelE/StbE